jgi:hypothetical protein
MKTLESERKLRNLRREIAELSQHDRQALGNTTVGAIMDQETQRTIESHCDIDGQLRGCVGVLIANGQTTIGAIANATGLNAAPLYRWFYDLADLKLASVVRLCQFLELKLVACEIEGRWDRNGQRNIESEWIIGKPHNEQPRNGAAAWTLRDRTPLSYNARFPHAPTPLPPAQGDGTPYTLIPPRPKGLKARKTAAPSGPKLASIPTSQPAPAKKSRSKKGRTT